jgi:hypothetical protein
MKYRNPLCGSKTVLKIGRAPLADHPSLETATQPWKHVTGWYWRADHPDLGDGPFSSFDECYLDAVRILKVRKLRLVKSWMPK